MNPHTSELPIEQFNQPRLHSQILFLIQFGKRTQTNNQTNRATGSEKERETEKSAHEFNLYVQVAIE